MEPHPRLTINTLAKKAGVSAMTVSRALRNLPNVSEKVRAKIKKLAQQMGYRPNPLISALFSQINSNKPVHYQASLAVFTPWNENPLPSQDWEHPLLVFKGMSARANQLGYKLETFSWKSVAEDPKKMDRILKARGIYGILAMPYPRSERNPETIPLPSMDWSRYALAGVFYSPSTPSFSRAGMDEGRNMKRALIHLQKLGYRRIGWAKHDIFEMRSLGMMDDIFQSFPKSKSDRIPIFQFTYGTSMSEKFRKWLSIHQPEVVISHVIDPHNWILQAGYSIPREIAYFSLDWIPAFGTTCSGLNNLRKAIGASAIDLVVEQINSNQLGLPQNPKFTMIEGTVQIGKTAPGLRGNAKRGSKKGNPPFTEKNSPPN